MVHADFTFERCRRTRLFLKHSQGATIPQGSIWTCPCGNQNPLLLQKDQHCPNCGTKLTLQEQREEGPNAKPAPGTDQFTIVRVAHFTVRGEDGKANVPVQGG